MNFLKFEASVARIKFELEGTQKKWFFENIHKGNKSFSWEFTWECEDFWWRIDFVTKMCEIIEFLQTHRWKSLR